VLVQPPTASQGVIAPLGSARSPCSLIVVAVGRPRGLPAAPAGARSRDARLDVPYLDPDGWLARRGVGGGGDDRRPDNRRPGGLAGAVAITGKYDAIPVRISQAGVETPTSRWSTSTGVIWSGQVGRPPNDEGTGPGNSLPLLVLRTCLAAFVPANRATCRPGLLPSATRFRSRPGGRRCRQPQICHGWSALSSGHPAENAGSQVQRWLVRRVDADPASTSGEPLRRLVTRAGPRVRSRQVIDWPARTNAPTPARPEGAGLLRSMLQGRHELPIAQSCRLTCPLPRRAHDAERCARRIATRAPESVGRFGVTP